MAAIIAWSVGGCGRARTRAAELAWNSATATAIAAAVRKRALSMRYLQRT
jgi:hypothetical protein